MKRAEFFGKGDIRIVEAQLREPMSKSVLVRVRACGVCGTDIHIFNGETGSADVSPPVVLGHEFSGEVVSAGSAVTSLRAGDHVTIDPNVYCGSCRPCRTGKKNLCSSMKAIGVTDDGGFAEYCEVPEAQCFLLSKEVPFAVGAMAEPLACCLRGSDLAGVRPGYSVFIVGGGAIGLLHALLAKLSGASLIIVSEPVEQRRKAALKLGADYVIDPVRSDPAAAVLEITNGAGADAVIECAGNLTATHQAFTAAGKGASVLLFSVPSPGSEYPLPLMDVFKKELRIFGSFVNPDTHQRAVELINSSRLDIEPLITHRFPLERIEEAIKVQKDRESIKVIVTP